MKIIKIFCLFLITLTVVLGCKKGNYPGGRVSPYLAIFDLRDLYKGKELTLTKDVMYGSEVITGVVVSDHSGNNMPAGLLVLQDRRRLSQLRGISVALGSDAAAYVPGDSIIINMVGGVLKRVDGILQVTGLSKAAITKVSSGNVISPNRVASNLIVASPDKYESTLSVIVKAGFNPVPGPTDVLSGDKTLNDGFADLTLHTEASASFANNKLAFLANYYGIVFNKQVNDTTLVPQMRLRTGNDVVVLSSTPEIAPVLITGFMSDVIGTDAPYEYIQFMATQDIDFAVTPYSVVTCNNANATIPTSYPALGWATGQAKTYKFNLTSGKAAKGTFFYVGGNKNINGSGSTSIATSNWIKSVNYGTVAGDGFGTATSGLLANSGNAFGMAIFQGTNVTVATAPVDVIFVSTGGALYTPTPVPQGYRIANTDFYDKKNPITLEDQPFYRSGTNTLALVYNTADLGIFNMLGGEYNPTLGRWTKFRSQQNITLTKTSPLDAIEGTSAGGVPTKLK